MKIPRTLAPMYFGIAVELKRLNPCLRLGQALFNVIPNCYTDTFHNDKRLDFYHWTDDNQVINTYYLAWVDCDA